MKAQAGRGKGNNGLMPSQQLLEPVVSKASLPPFLGQNAIPWQSQR